MRLGIISDTHDQLDRTKRAVDLLQSHGAETLVHCGDLCTSPILEACAVLPLWFVFGNNDCDEVPDLLVASREMNATCLKWGGVAHIGGKKVGVTHGHLRTDINRVLSEHPDYLLSGHSHMSHDSVVDSVRHINPGAIYRAAKYTVAILDLVTEELTFITVPRP